MPASQRAFPELLAGTGTPLPRRLRPLPRPSRPCRPRARHVRPLLTESCSPLPSCYCASRDVTNARLRYGKRISALQDEIDELGLLKVRCGFPRGVIRLSTGVRDILNYCILPLKALCLHGGFASRENVWPDDVLGYVGIAWLLTGRSRRSDSTRSFAGEERMTFRKH